MTKTFTIVLPRHQEMPSFGNDLTDQQSGVRELFRILNFGHWNLFVIWILRFGFWEMRAYGLLYIHISKSSDQQFLCQ
jgi:hypothetical protein